MQPLRMEKVYFVELARQVVCEFLDGGLEVRYQIVFDSSQESETASIMGDERHSQSQRVRYFCFRSAK